MYCIMEPKEIVPASTLLFLLNMCFAVTAFKSVILTTVVISTNCLYWVKHVTVLLILNSKPTQTAALIYDEIRKRRC